MRLTWTTLRAWRALFAEASAVNPWLQRWQARCAIEGGDGAQREARMRQVNPWIIPRNHRVEEALAAASSQGDLQPFKALLAARQRGVRIRIIVPGEHIDSEAVRLASKAEWGPLLQAGVAIHEYTPTMMHNKLLIVDSEMVSVGSTNFDVRSFRLNDEASLNVYDRELAARMTREFEKCPLSSL